MSRLETLLSPPPALMSPPNKVTVLICGGTPTVPSRQCVAVTAHVAETKEAPQVDPRQLPPEHIPSWCGHWHRWAGVPLIMATPGSDCGMPRSDCGMPRSDCGKPRSNCMPPSGPGLLLSMECLAEVWRRFTSRTASTWRHTRSKASKLCNKLSIAQTIVIPKMLAFRKTCTEMT